MMKLPGKLFQINKNTIIIFLMIFSHMRTPQTLKGPFSVLVSVCLAIFKDHEIERFLSVM